MISSIHDVRFLNFAILDILGTFLVIYVIYKYKLIKVSFSTLLVLSLIFTIFIHIIFGVNTTLNYYLGLSDKPSRYKTNYKLA